MAYLRGIIIFCSLILWALSAAGAGAQAEKPEEESSARAQELYKQIRCVVCEGQSLAGSQVPLARAMRAQIREDIRAGKSNAEILAGFQKRYGDKVLLRPPVRGETYFLWLSPILLLALGTILIWRMRRK